MVISLEQGADLHMAQLMPLPLTVCCFTKIHIGFTFLVPAHPGSSGQRAIKRVCVCVCVCVAFFSGVTLGRSGSLQREPFVVIRTCFYRLDASYYSYCIG